jgi:hypothetical protein
MQVVDSEFVRCVRNTSRQNPINVTCDPGVVEIWTVCRWRVGSFGNTLGPTETQ